MKRKYVGEGELTVRRLQPLTKDKDKKRQSKYKKKAYVFAFTDMIVFCEPIKTVRQIYFETDFRPTKCNGL